MSQDLAIIAKIIAVILIIVVYKVISKRRKEDAYWVELDNWETVKLESLKNSKIGGEK